MATCNQLVRERAKACGALMHGGAESGGGHCHGHGGRKHGGERERPIQDYETKEHTTDNRRNIDDISSDPPTRL
eukprot:5289321-Pleurochrysis_carterae.AAC.1